MFKLNFAEGKTEFVIEIEGTLDEIFTTVVYMIIIELTQFFAGMKYAAVQQKQHKFERHFLVNCDSVSRTLHDRPLIETLTKARILVTP